MTKTSLLRVTQMNAVYFDNEIYKIFLEHVHDCLKYLPPGYLASSNDEIRLLVKLILLWYSIGKCDSTFGQKLLSIKYKNVSPLKKLLFFTKDVIEYLMDKLQAFNNKNVNYCVINLRAIIQICSFLNISAFLRTGVKPRLTERILSLDQSYINPNSVQRQYDTQYMTRELLWDSFIEILIYILPLLNYYKIKRSIRCLNPFHKRPSHSFNSKKPIINTNTKCPHCSEFPILPHHMGCEHIFCYTCLKGNQIADSKYECPVCEYSSAGNLCERLI